MRSKRTSVRQAYLRQRSDISTCSMLQFTDSSYFQHMAKQLANAREKIERAQQHIEDKRIASQQAIERLEKKYQNMAIERRDTDKHNGSVVTTGSKMGIAISSAAGERGTARTGYLFNTFSNDPFNKLWNDLFLLLRPAGWIPSESARCISVRHNLRGGKTYMHTFGVMS